VIDRKYLPVLIVAVIAVSTAAPIIRLAESPPLAIAFWRVMLAACAFGLIHIFLPGSKWSPGAWGLTWLAGVFLGLHFWVWITSLQFTSIANSVLLVTTQPVWAALIGRIFLHERVPLRGWLGIGVTLCGSAATIGYAGVQLSGDLLAVAGGILAAAYMVVGRRERQRWDIVPYLTRVYLAAAATLAVPLLLSSSALIPDSRTEWGLLAFLALVPTGLGHSFYNFTLRHLPTYVVATAITGEPVGATLLGYVLLGEVPSERTLMFAPLVLLGIVLVASSHKVKAIPGQS
jgi:drug/metabolite transporter (DMT)-like permease